MKRFFPLVLALFIYLSASMPSLAHHRGRVLGASTPSSDVNFPSISNGPGFILPDSPLYFLDKIKQDIRLLIAITPEDKAKIHQNIAGERVAELRIMFARNHQKGIDRALLELKREVNSSAKELTNAELSGRNIATTAKEINDSIKSQRDVLSSLEKQTNGTLQLQIGLAKMAIKEAKAEVEDTLPEDELNKEIQESMEDELEDEIDDTSEHSDKITNLISELNKEASEAAKHALNKREEALKKAIEIKNEELKKKQEKLLESEKKKQEKYFELKKKSIEKSKQEAEKIREAAKKLKESQNEMNEIQNSTRELDKSMLEFNSSIEIQTMLTPSPNQTETKEVENENEKEED